MFASPKLVSAAAFVRRAASLVAILGTVTLAACGDDGDGGTGPGGDITGTWTAEEGGVREYVHITTSTITIYTDLGGECFIPIEFEIVERDGNQYTLETFGETGVVEITRSGDQITVDDGEDSYVYTRSSVNVDNLELCDGGGPGPEPVTCSSLPSLPDGTTNGSLTTSDGESGFYYDLYRLQLSSTQNVQITLRSNAFDAYLMLFGDNVDEFIAEDDDSGEGTTGFDSQITETLSAGCYIVMATSYEGDVTGNYSLIVSTN